MNAHPTPDLLMALDEGVLPAELAAEVAGHLAECRVCAQLREDLRTSTVGEPTLAEMERVRRRVLARRAPAWRGWAWGALAASVALAALLWRMSPVAVEAPRPAERELARGASPAVSREGAPVARPEPAYRLTAEPAPLRLPFAAALVLRGAENQLPEAYLKELGAALAPYRAGRYAEGATALAALGERFPKAVEPAFYEGVARLLAGDAAAAVPRLERAQSIGGEALNEEIAWYLAIGYERTAQWERARALLAGLCRGEGPHRAAACQAVTPP